MWSETKVQDVKEAAHRGAQFLDNVLPEGWFREIKVDRIELNSCIDCILGQLFGGYSAGLTALEADMMAAETEDYYPPEFFGFVGGSTDNDYAWSTLTREWRKLIAERQGVSE